MQRMQKSAFRVKVNYERVYILMGAIKVNLATISEQLRILLREVNLWFYKRSS